MSALPPKADMCGAIGDVCFGPKADSCSAAKKIVIQSPRWLAREALGGRLCREPWLSEVDHQLELGRCLHRKVGRLLALEDAIDVASGKSVQLNTIRAIRDQAARGCIEPLIVDPGQLVPCRECNNQIAM